MDELADLPNEVLTPWDVVTHFQLDSKEQGTKFGHGIMTGHNANDGALTGNNVGANLGTQATGAPKYGNAPSQSNSA